MKRLGLVLLCGAAVCLFGARSANAFPEFKKGFDAKYVEGNSNADFVAAVEEAKCNVCHYGKSKKNRNDYGKALSKYIDKEKRDELKADAEVLAKAVDEALDKAAAEKKEGDTTFGDLLKAGKLPGTTPPDAEE